MCEAAAGGGVVLGVRRAGGGREAAGERTRCGRAAGEFQLCLFALQQSGRYHNRLLPT